MNGCVFSGSDAGSFARSGQSELCGPTTTAQSIGLSCTAGSAKRTATLTCNETIGAGKPVTALVAAGLARSVARWTSW